MKWNELRIRDEPFFSIQSSFSWASAKATIFSMKISLLTLANFSPFSRSSPQFSHSSPLFLTMFNLLANFSALSTHYTSSLLTSTLHIFHTINSFHGIRSELLQASDRSLFLLVLLDLYYCHTLFAYVFQSFDSWIICIHLLLQCFRWWILLFCILQSIQSWSTCCYYPINTCNKRNHSLLFHCNWTRYPLNRTMFGCMTAQRISSCQEVKTIIVQETSIKFHLNRRSGTSIAYLITAWVYPFSSLEIVSWQCFSRNMINFPWCLLWVAFRARLYLHTWVSNKS